MTNDATRASDTALPKMIEAHRQTKAAINAHEGEPCHPEVVALCEHFNEIALAICGYRPRTADEQHRKAAFLLDWTEATELTGEEQNALIASMLPEGGEA